MNYWGYRIDTNERDFFYTEAEIGNLRQGWGWDKNQDLSLGDNTDESAKRNLPIFNKVKKGDILLVPRLKAWDEILILEATEDFDKGYSFSIDPEKKDYGHKFPVKIIKRFSRHNINVAGDIRETLKCRSRFWNINRCEDQIKKILSLPNSELLSDSSYEESFREKVEAAFDEEVVAKKLYNDLNNAAQASEWEFILCEGFRRICRASYSIETTSNKTENLHGADIIIRIPGILDNSYVIAIQVKDYADKVDKTVINQINKADDYFAKEEGSTLIDKYLIITKARSEINEELLIEAKKSNVKILFDKDIIKLLSKMARGFLADAILE